MSPPLERLHSHAQQWSVTLQHHWETQTSVLASGLRRETRVVLKVTKQPGDEWHSGEVLRAFEGDGAVKLYESTPGAVLLERLDPGNDLVALVHAGNDDAATKILADVSARLANHM